MKTNHFFHLLMLVALFGFTLSSCKKDTTTSNSTPTQIAAAQDAESQDALATKVEQGADDQADAIESSNFNTSDLKAGNANGVTVEVDHPDTTYFPKVITLTYNFEDTVNGDWMTQTGIITITVDTIPVGHKLWWRKHVSRSFVFTNFSVATDSCSFTINGTRNMDRRAWIPTLSGNKLDLRVEIKDTIYSDLTIGITNGDFSGNFTRKVSRNRDIDVHYYKSLASNKIWRRTFLNDTITFTGSITGVNLMGENYERLITSPLIFSLCPVWPHDMLAKGVITDTEGANVTTITYAPDGCKNHVSATDANGNKVPINRKPFRKFHKWW